MGTSLINITMKPPFLLFWWWKPQPRVTLCIAKYIFVENTDVLISFTRLIGNFLGRHKCIHQKIPSYNYILVAEKLGPLTSMTISIKPNKSDVLISFTRLIGSFLGRHKCIHKEIPPSTCIQKAGLGSCVFAATKPQI